MLVLDWGVDILRALRQGPSSLSPQILAEIPPCVKLLKYDKESSAFQAAWSQGRPSLKAVSFAARGIREFGMPPPETRTVHVDGSGSKIGNWRQTGKDSQHLLLLLLRLFVVPMSYAEQQKYQRFRRRHRQRRTVSVVILGGGSRPPPYPPAAADPVAR